MKSRFDALTSSDHRHGRAVFRASAAVSIVVSILALGGFHHDREVGAMRSDLFALEIGLVQPVQVTDTEFALPVHAGPAHARTSAQDEFSFGPYYSGEAGGY